MQTSPKHLNSATATLEKKEKNLFRRTFRVNGYRDADGYYLCYSISRRKKERERERERERVSKHRLRFTPACLAVYWKRHNLGWKLNEIETAPLLQQQLHQKKITSSFAKARRRRAPRVIILIHLKRDRERGKEKKRKRVARARDRGAKSRAPNLHHTTATARKHPQGVIIFFSLSHVVAYYNAPYTRKDEREREKEKER